MILTFILFSYFPELRDPMAPEPQTPDRPERQEEAADSTIGRIDCLSLAAIRPVSRPFCLRAVCVLLTLAVSVVFWQTVDHDFVNFDDNVYIYNNPHVREGLTGAGTAWAFTTYYADNWHPLTWLSHMVDCHLYGMKAGGHHGTNVLLHISSALILFLTLRRMTLAVWPSAWVAAVFAIHPLRVESVAWVAERKDVLSGLFFMLTLWFYACYAEQASWGRYLLVVVSFALSLTAKPMLVTLPFVLLLLDYWPLQRFGLRRAASQEDQADPPRSGQPFVQLFIEKTPLFVLAALSCAMTLRAQREAIVPLDQRALSWRIGNAGLAYVAYLGKMIYPADLAVYYPLPNEPPPMGKVAAAAGALIAISVAVVALRRTCPYLLVGWLWYLGTLAPVIGLVQVGTQKMADRYTYLTQIGLYVAIAWGALHAVGPRPERRRVLAAVSTMVVAALMACAWRQTRHWHDSEALWNHTLACTSPNAVAHNNLGLVLAGRGQVDEAVSHYRQALEINRNSVEAHNNLGLALAGRGQIDEAVFHYRQALEVRPDDAAALNNLGLAFTAQGQIDEAIAAFSKAVEFQPEYADAHNNLGAALASCGRLDEAIAHYRKSVEFRPDHADAYNNLARALAARGQFDEAIAHYRKTLALKPDYAEAYNNLGKALARRGHVDEAISNYRQAVKFKPDFAEAYINLGLALVGRGQVDEAISTYRQVLAFKPDYAEGYNNLGIALRGRGQVDEAIAQFRKSLQLKPDYAEAYNNLGIALRGCGQVDEAIAQFRKSLQFKPEQIEAHFNLGFTLASRGKVAEAIEHHQKALDLAAARNDEAVAAAIRANINKLRPEGNSATGP